MIHLKLYNALILRCLYFAMLSEAPVNDRISDSGPSSSRGDVSTCEAIITNLSGSIHQSLFWRR